MALEKHAYFTLPIREKINLFLQISDRNQVLTDLSGVNNNKISKLKRDPSLINNIQLVNVNDLKKHLMSALDVNILPLRTLFTYLLATYQKMN